MLRHGSWCRIKEFTLGMLRSRWGHIKASILNRRWCRIKEFTLRMLRHGRRCRVKVFTLRTLRRVLRQASFQVRPVPLGCAAGGAVSGGKPRRAATQGVAQRQALRWSIESLPGELTLLPPSLNARR